MGQSSPGSPPWELLAVASGFARYRFTFRRHWHDGHFAIISARCRNLLATAMAPVQQAVIDSDDPAAYRGVRVVP